MSLDTILESIKAKLEQALPELKTVEIAGGRIDLADKRRRARPLPAAFIFCGGTDNGIEQGGKAKSVGLFGVVLAVQERAAGQPTPGDRPRQIARIAGRALKVIIKAKVWDNPELEKPPTDVRSRNKYATDADNHDLALWAITWAQELALTSDDPPVELDDFTTLHATWELQDGSTPAVDAVDHIEVKP
ncbi:hypothetical protein OV079_23775 [Nannocystis pusilla]|uniref:Uncharacterized protein n=1 Tax=Nannocystis pusilla TaxID=889268 RepID=A0A9X3EQQ4_9BACT|nr:hypothetical protein [Nannocystis pusilla]MCY1003997.1 hypothetical protein [Nannocystis pusilla]MCY1008522.1 hypothetical protein [Nannocystis pusilla]